LQSSVVSSLSLSGSWSPSTEVDRAGGVPGDGARIGSSVWTSGPISSAVASNLTIWVGRDVILSLISLSLYGDSERARRGEIGGFLRSMCGTAKNEEKIGTERALSLPGKGLLDASVGCWSKAG
jgi:hypothetical protein